jgi:hypothetical protein
LARQSFGDHRQKEEISRPDRMDHSYTLLSGKTGCVYAAQGIS